MLLNCVNCKMMKRKRSIVILSFFVVISSAILFYFINNHLSFAAAMGKTQFVIQTKIKNLSQSEKFNYNSSKIPVMLNYPTNIDHTHRAGSYAPNYWDKKLESDFFTDDELRQYFMWTNQSSCQLSHDFGGKIMHNPSGIAGQKSVCLDPQIAPQPSKCLVYSFGINNDWSFDEHMEQYGCQVFAFDPSMGVNHHNHSSRIHFYNWGLGDRDEYDSNFNWTLRSLSSIYKSLSNQHGHKVIDYLKIDIEYSEWIVLPHIIKSAMLSKIRQLGIEIHLDYQKSPSEEHLGRARLLRLLEKNGMIRFDSKYNPWFVGISGNSFGYEIAWYNIKLQFPS